MINNKEYAKIVGRNLRRIMYDREVSQAQLANDLKLTKSTVSSWMNGYRTPRMDKIDMLCNYLHCKRPDLMEPHSAEYRYVQLVMLENCTKKAPGSCYTVKGSYFAPGIPVGAYLKSAPNFFS